MTRITSQKTRQAILVEGAPLDLDGPLPDNIMLFDAAGNPLMLSSTPQGLFWGETVVPRVFVPTTIVNPEDIIFDTSGGSAATGPIAPVHADLPCEVVMMVSLVATGAQVPYAAITVGSVPVAMFRLDAPGSITTILKGVVGAGQEYSLEFVTDGGSVVFPADLTERVIGTVV